MVSQAVLRLRRGLRELGWGPRAGICWGGPWELVRNAVSQLHLGPTELACAFSQDPQVMAQ